LPFLFFVDVLDKKISPVSVKKHYIKLNFQKFAELLCLFNGKLRRIFF